LLAHHIRIHRRAGPGCRLCWVNHSDKSQQIVSVLLQLCRPEIEVEQIIDGGACAYA
jgi:hypothetical protein